MKKISQCKKYIATSEGSFKIYRRGTFALVHELPAAGAVAYELHDAYLFVAYDDGRLEAIGLDGLGVASIVEAGRRHVTALFSRENFLYVGTREGLVLVYAFNAQAFRIHREYKHGMPVLAVASDNISTFVVDHRDRITEYPAARGYDFSHPSIYMGRYLHCVEKNRIYVRTRDAFGLLCELDGDVEGLLLSEKGGFIFPCIGGRTRCIDTATGECLGEYVVGDAVVVDEAFVSCGATGLELTDLFFEDKELDVAFRRVEIKEKKIGADDFDRKYAFVDDGNGKPIRKKRESAGSTRSAYEALLRPAPSKYDPRAMPSENKVMHKSLSADPIKSPESKMMHKGNKNKHEAPEAKEEGGHRRKLEESSSEECGAVMKENVVNSADNTLGRIKRPIVEDGTALLSYSAEGFMLSIESPIASHVTVKYHDNAVAPVEIKDQHKCGLGAFCGRRFVLSNGSLLNFNDEWTAEVKAVFVGLNDEHVFAVGDVLTVFDFKGNVVREVFLADAQAFCCAPGRVAVFTGTYLLLMRSGAGGSYVPAEGVAFCAFDGDVLYAVMRGSLFRLREGLFERVCSAPGRSLAVYGDFLLTLAEPYSLLPRPRVEYNEMQRRAPAAVEHMAEPTKKFSIMKGFE